MKGGQGSRVSSRKPDLRELFDRAAEALILIDPDDAESCAELVSAVKRLAEAASEQGNTECVEPVLHAAEAVAAGELDRLKDLEGSFTRARQVVLESAAAGTKGGLRQRPAGKVPVDTEGSGAGEIEGPSAGVSADSVPPAASAMPLAGDEELLRDFAIRAGEHLDDADEGLLALEGDGADREAVDAVFRAFHTIKGMSGFLALDAISALAHEAESLLADARAHGSTVDGDSLRALFVAVDKMRILVADVGGLAPAATPEAGGDRDAESGDPTPGGELEQRERRVEGQPRASSRAGTLRVDGERLDGLLDAIGELVIAESMVSAAVRNGGELSSVASKLDQLDKITRELQQMATSLRMVPLRAVFRRMARLVHDVSAKAGKPIEFVTTGEDTELDKTVVERIEDPLVHALRNAIDHGIESPEERRAAGKPKTARIELSAFHSGGAIHIEVRDDGRGIDPSRVAAKAAEAGLADSEIALEGRSLLDLLCAPGFSTADEVTDVSGRGVGMDVVRRTVEDLRGRLDLLSEVGSGTTFSIRLPVTLAIIDGMVLRVGGDRFILPLLAIERSVRPLAAEIETVAARGEMLAVEGEQLIPLVRLHHVFSVEDAESDPWQAVVVIVNENGVRAGLLACELLGQQQTVIKPLGEGLPDMPGVAGGAVMPDGRVGLILDAAGLVRSAHQRGGE